MMSAERIPGFVFFECSQLFMHFHIERDGGVPLSILDCKVVVSIISMCMNTYLCVWHNFALHTYKSANTGISLIYTLDYGNCLHQIL